jgi:EAL domain-containing protein (putative c-di-GMP-specific phosphodiesterase class I)
LIVDLVQNMTHQKRVSHITALVREKGGLSIAALVQDASSLAVLFQCGIDYIQGYFMQAPADVFSEEELDH